MDKGLAWAALGVGPALWAACRLLSGVAEPLVAAGLALLLYWAALAWALGRRADRDRLAQLLPLEGPGALVGAALALPVLVAGGVTLRLLGEAALPPHVLLACALAALAHAALSEMAWRGALIPEARPSEAALALGLFTLAQAGWLGLTGLDLGFPGPAVVLGALALGGVWTAARLESGTLGAGLLSHAGLNLFLFAGIAARNGATV